MLNKIVLAYSGGLDTSVAIKWLREKYKAKIIAFCADLGQGEDLKEVRKKALDDYHVESQGRIRQQCEQRPRLRREERVDESFGEIGLRCAPNIVKLASRIEDADERRHSDHARP